MLYENVRYIVFSDLDGTLTKVNSSWQYIMEYFELWETKGKHHLHSFLNGEINYNTFLKLDVETWKGLPDVEYMKAINKIPFRSGILEVFEFFRNTGAYIYLISSGLMDLASRAKKLFPVDEIFANIILRDSGHLNGKDIKKVGWNDIHSKSSIISSILKIKPIHIPVLALGDSSGDYPLLECADLSFSCFSSDQKLNQLASYCINEKHGFNEIPRLVKKFLKVLKLI